MSPRKILLLTAAVFILFAFIFFFERKMPTTEERERKGSLVWDLPEDRIESVRLEHGSTVIELKKGNGSGWRLIKPESYPADAIAVSDLVSQLARLKRTGGDSSEAQPDDYGLKSPTARVAILWKDEAKPKKKHSNTVDFGLDIPGTDATAARVSGSDGVVFVPSVVATAAKKNADDFKSKDVFGRSSADVARLDVERGRGRLSLEKKNNQWWLDQPLSDLADGDAIPRLIGDLTGLRVLEFVSGAERQNLASLGLSPPLYRVTMADAKKASTTVEFGATRSDGNSVYARRDGQVFTVPSTITEELSKEAIAFRESHLVRFDRASANAIEGKFGGEGFSLVRKDAGWSLGGRPLVASAADDLITAVLDLKSRSFSDEGESNAPETGEPLATVVVSLPGGESWKLKLYPQRGETQATVSRRSGAFLLGRDAVDTLEKAFKKAAVAFAPTPAPTKAPKKPPDRKP